MIVFSLLLLALLLFFPSAALAGSRYGATLWLSELLPTLLPFFIAIRLFQYSMPKAAASRPFLLTGLLCGYPVGASLVAFQYNRRLLSEEDAYFYLGFVNNPSPMFILVFCGQTVLGLPYFQTLSLFFIQIGSCLIGSLLFRLLYSMFPFGAKEKAKQKKSTIPSSKPACTQVENPDRQRDSQSPSEVIDSIILDSFTVMLNIGGYVILFSILGQLIRLLMPGNPVFSLLGCGIMEISSGASLLKFSTLAIPYKKVLLSAMLAFGGLSAAFQTNSILAKTELSILPYSLNKAINGIIAAVLTFLLSGAL